MSEPTRYIQTYRYNVAANEDDAIINATYFAWFLRREPHRWSLNAICAALGNWEVETLLNPNYPQYSSFPESGEGGFGMPHWTPWWYKIGQWAYDRYGIEATATDDNPLADFALQMEYHEYECIYGVDGGATWYSNHGYSYEWNEWKRSTDDVQELAAAYYYQYERSGSGAPGDRPRYAQKWWEYFQEHPIPGSLPVWLLFKLKERRDKRR